MKFASALAIAAVSQAAKLENIIDLCPDYAAAQYAAPMTYQRPSASELMAVVGHGDLDYSLGSKQEFSLGSGERFNLNMDQIQALASALQESRFEAQQPKGGYI